MKPGSKQCAAGGRPASHSPVRPGCQALAISIASAAALAATAAAEVPVFAVRAVDEATGRAVPLVEFRSTNEVRYFTDNNGVAAVIEPSWEGEEIFFHVRGHGYSVPADGFGYRGVRLTVAGGGRAEVKLGRDFAAERLYRITGDGRFRDSRLAGLPVPGGEGRAAPGGVFGQDSTQAVVHRDKVFWFWGDTNRAGYPLGNFHTAGATSPLPRDGVFDPAKGIPLTYITGGGVPDGFVKPLYLRRDNEPGPVWTDGVFSLEDPNGVPRIVAHYTRVKNLGTTLEHGLAVFDEDAGMFKRELVLPLDEEWRFPQGHAFAHTAEDGSFIYFAQPFPVVRVAAQWEAVFDPGRYERVTGVPASLTDAEAGGEVTVHRASVRWNGYRKAFVLIGVQQGGAGSFLGDVWFAEAPRPTGPWTKAVRVASHDGYTFYNPVHHAFLDEEGGRVIFFEGTYAHTFSKTPRAAATPRYDYNQVLYRLDLADDRLGAARIGRD